MTQVMWKGITIEIDNSLPIGTMKPVAVNDDPDQELTILMSTQTFEHAQQEPERQDKYFAITTAMWNAKKGNHIKALAKNEDK